MVPTRRDREKQQRRRTDASEWAKKQTRGFEPTAIKPPNGASLYKLEVGTHLVDIIPYRVGKRNRQADPGFEHFELEYIVHSVPMANGRTNLYCCSLECFGKPCYVCDWMREHGKDDKEMAKALRGKVRHLWNVNDEPGDSKNPLKVFDTNHYNRGIGFGEMMADAISSVSAYGNFSELTAADGGMTLQLTVKEHTWPPNGKANMVTRIDFLPRKYDYDEDIIDRTIMLEDCLVETPYEKMQKIMDRGSDGSVDAESNGRAEKGHVSHGKAKEPEEIVETNRPEFAVGDTVIYQDMECKIKKISGDGTSYTLIDEDEEIHRAVSPDDITHAGRDNKEPPTKKKETSKKDEPEKKSVSKPSKKGDDVKARYPTTTEDDEDIDEDEIDDDELEDDDDLEDEDE